MSKIEAQRAILEAMAKEADAGRKVSPDVQAAMAAILEVHPSLMSNPTKLLAAAQAKVEARNEATWGKAVGRVNQC